MPVVSVNRDRLFEALGKVYSESKDEEKHGRERGREKKKNKGREN
jgi:predicted transposase YdaD